MAKKTPKKFLKDLDIKSFDTPWAAANKTTEELLKDLDNDDYFVRKSAAYHPKATTQVLMKALEDNDYRVRVSAVGNPRVTATPEVLLKAMEDENYDVRKFATWHHNATPEVLLKAVEDENGDVREAAADNPLIKTLPISDEKWFQLIAEGAFDGITENIPSRIKKDPRYKASRLLSKLSSE